MEVLNDPFECRVVILKIVCKPPVLYAAGLNIDYFPTNFVVREEKLYYIDFECNPYEQQWDFQHWGSRYWWKSEEFIKHFGEDAQ
jgi:hypothetical protein